MSRIDVENIFDGYLNTILLTQPTALDFIKKHERKEVVISNLMEQIIKAEKFNLNFNVTKYKLVIESVAKMFAKVALEHAEQRILSDNERIRRVHEQDTIKRAEEMMVDLDNEAKDERLKSFGGYDGSSPKDN